MSEKRAVFGHPVGILMQKDRIIRIPGDIGNATTFDFPVRYAIIDDVDPKELKRPERLPYIAPRFIRAAQLLENEGVRLIAGGCGFLSILQSELSRAVRIPVLSSSLLQVPMVATATGCRKIGIVTADSQALDDRFFAPLGWSSKTIDVVVIGIENEVGLLNTLYCGTDPEEVLSEGEKVLAQVAGRLVDEHNDIGAIVLECTNLPPYSKIIAEVTGLPVFDAVTLVKWGYDAVVRKHFCGYL